MSRFEVYTEQVEVNTPAGTSQITLAPVKGVEEYTDWLIIQDAFTKGDMQLENKRIKDLEQKSNLTKKEEEDLEKLREKQGKNFLEKLDVETFQAVYRLVCNSIKNGHPKENMDDIEQHVSANLYSFVAPVLKLHSPNGQKQ